MAPPFRQCEFDIMYGKGISKEGSLLDVGVDLEIVKKSGAWFTYEGEQLGQGRENARQFLAEHIDMRDEIERKVREAVGLTSFGEGDDEPIRIERGRGAPAGGAARRGRARHRRAVQGQGVELGAAACPGRERRRTPRAATSERSGSSPCVRGADGSSSAGSSRRGSRRTRSQDVLTRLERVGLVDDEAFARQFAEHRFGSRKEGSRAVMQGLRAAGIAPGLAEAVAQEPRATTRSGRPTWRARGSPGSPACRPRRRSPACPPC